MDIPMPPKWATWIPSRSSVVFRMHEELKSARGAISANFPCDFALYEYDNGWKVVLSCIVGDKCHRCGKPWHSIRIMGARSYAVQESRGWIYPDPAGSGAFCTRPLVCETCNIRYQYFEDPWENLSEKLKASDRHFGS